MKIKIDNDHVGEKSIGDIISPEIHQGNTNNCAIHAQYHILKEYGFSGSVDDLIQESFENGWSSEDGTHPKDVGKLLESNGVSCTQVIGANEFRLYAELAQGKSVLVGVDADELWYGIGNSAAEAANHALTVIGMDFSDPDNIQVIVTDSGTGHAAKAYPIEEFMDAWQDSNCTMVVPNEPPPKDMDIERLSNFDYELGHIEQFGEFSFEMLVELQVAEDEVELTVGMSVAFDDDDPFADLDSIEGFGSSKQTALASGKTEAETSEFDEDDPFADLGAVEAFSDTNTPKEALNDESTEQEDSFDVTPEEDSSEFSGDDSASDDILDEL